MPTNSLPKVLGSVFATSKRKPPTERKQIPPNRLYCTAEKMLKAAGAIQAKSGRPTYNKTKTLVADGSSFLDNWVFFEKNGSVIGIFEDNDYKGLAPRLRCWCSFLPFGPIGIANDKPLLVLS